MPDTVLEFHPENLLRARPISGNIWWNNMPDIPDVTLEMCMQKPRSTRPENSYKFIRAHGSCLLLGKPLSVAYIYLVAPSGNLESCPRHSRFYRTHVCPTTGLDWTAVAPRFSVGGPIPLLSSGNLKHFSRFSPVKLAINFADIRPLVAGRGCP